MKISFPKILSGTIGAVVAVAAVAILTAGHASALTSGQTTITFTPSSANPATGVTYFGSGAYSITVPAGVTSITAKVWGAGGGGGGGNCSGCSGDSGGGGGGGYTQKTFNVTQGDTYIIYAGKGGSGKSGNNSGGDGLASYVLKGTGASSYGPTSYQSTDLFATGGKGGQFSGNSSLQIGGQGGSGNNGDAGMNLSGNAGQDALNLYGSRGGLNGYDNNNRTTTCASAPYNQNVNAYYVAYGSIPNFGTPADYLTPGKAFCEMGFQDNEPNTISSNTFTGFDHPSYPPQSGYCANGSGGIGCNFYPNLVQVSPQWCYDVTSQDPNVSNSASDFSKGKSVSYVCPSNDIINNCNLNGKCNVTWTNWYNPIAIVLPQNQDISVPATSGTWCEQLGSVTYTSTYNQPFNPYSAFYRCTTDSSLMYISGGRALITETNGGDGYSPGNGGAAGRGSYSGGNGGDGLVVIQYNNTPVASNVDFSITPGANVSVPPNTSSVSNTAVLKMISGSATDGFFDGFVLDSTGNDQNMTLGISSSGGGSIIPPATVNFSFSYGNSQSSFAVGNTYTAYITEAVVNGISVLCGDKNQSNTSSPPLPYYEHCNIISSGPNLWVVAAAQSSSLYNNFISQVVGSNCGTGGYTVNSFDNNVQYVYCNILNNVKIKNNIAIHTAKFNITVVPAPTLTPTPHCSYIFLSWSPVAGAAKYVITRTTGGTNAQTSTTTGTTYSDNTAGLITMYAYTVQPVDANGASIGAPSNTMYANIDPYANNGPTVLSCKATNVTATTNCGTPTQAAAVLDAVLAAGAGSGNTPPSTGSYVTVSWTVPGDTANLVGYNIYRNGVKLNASPVTASPYYDPAANVSSVNSYVVKSVYTVNGAQTEVDSSSAVSSQTCNSNNTQSITVNATPASVCPSGATTFPVQVSWNQISGAGTYNLRIMSTDSSGNNPNYNYAIGVTSPYTDNNTVPNNIYTYTVTALDGSGNTIASGSSVPLTGTACPNNNNQSQVQLWFHGAMPTGQNANWNNQTKTVSAGTPVTLDYAWPSSLGLCNGRTDSYPTGSIPPASWNGISLSLSGNTQGSKTLNDLKQGTYILHVSCPNPNPNILVQLLSNTVKIIVTKTSIQEI